MLRATLRRRDSSTASASNDPISGICLWHSASSPEIDPENPIVLRYTFGVNARSETLTAEDYRILSEFRHQIRRFLGFSTQAAREYGLEPRQHQLLLAVKGMPVDVEPTIGELAEHLQIRHNTAVELVDRLEERGLVMRRRGVADRRKVYVDLTEQGEALLTELSLHHLRELRSIGPELVRALDALTEE
jgi:DNA-binding MarR family transcriptional regulator